MSDAEFRRCYPLPTELVSPDYHHDYMLQQTL